jgi:hypothetical protein
MWGERSKDEKAAQIIERLEADGLANVMDYQFDTAQIVEVPEDHWAHGTWRWALVMESMDGGAPEVFVGSPWPIEACLEAHTWEVVDHISDSTIVPFVLKNPQSIVDYVKEQGK